MPLTAFQQRVLATLATRPERYLAGGAALHQAPDSLRYSDHLDFFHDAEARVAAAFADDRATLEAAGFSLELAFSQPGFIRAIVSLGADATRVDWAHDTAWRFFPLRHEPWGGWVLHPVDLAINKVLALAGRNEPRDVLDLLWCDTHILGAPALLWAAPGKDPGLSPLGLIELLARRGRVEADELERLALREVAPTPASIREAWRALLARAEDFARARPASEVGALYLDASGAAQVPVASSSLAEQDLRVHRGGPGGVVPRISPSEAG